MAHSELYPTLAAVVLSQINRYRVLLGARFYRQTAQTFTDTLRAQLLRFLTSARASRIEAAQADLLAANLTFNDAHRELIYQVHQTFYRLLNASGQEDAALASLVNAQNVQRAAGERLKNGSATLPDVLEARSATEQAEYGPQSVLGAEEIARGDLATALGASETLSIQVPPLDQIATPESIGDTVDQEIDRAPHITLTNG